MIIMKKRLFILALAVCMILACSGIVIAAGDSQNLAASDAWQELLKGNQRFVAGERAIMNFPNKRIELIAGQHPFAAVISCSDSRVPPELLFDQGLGDLFIIRVAGNVAGPIELGSIEYGIEHLHIPLLVVLGHQACGAVDAAVQGPAGGNIQSILNEIEPAVKIAKKTPRTGNLVEDSVDENVKLVIKNILKRSPITEEYVKEGKLTVIGAKYFFDTGKIEVIEVVDDASVSATLNTSRLEAVLIIAIILAIVFFVSRIKRD